MINGFEPGRTENVRRQSLRTVGTLAPVRRSDGVNTADVAITVIGRDDLQVFHGIHRLVHRGHLVYHGGEQLVRRVLVSERTIVQCHVVTFLIHPDLAHFAQRTGRARAVDRDQFGVFGALRRVEHVRTTIFHHIAPQDGAVERFTTRRARNETVGHESLGGIERAPDRIVANAIADVGMGRARLATHGGGTEFAIGVVVARVAFGFGVFRFQSVRARRARDAIGGVEALALATILVAAGVGRPVVQSTPVRTHRAHLLATVHRTDDGCAVARPRAYRARLARALAGDGVLP